VPVQIPKQTTQSQPAPDQTRLGQSYQVPKKFVTATGPEEGSIASTSLRLDHVWSTLHRTHPHPQHQHQQHPATLHTLQYAPNFIMAAVLPSDGNSYFAATGLRCSLSHSNFISSTSPYSTSSHLSEHYEPASKSYAESN
jgi:hypothetical protein